MDWFTWKVEIKVHRTWVEDGFDLTDERVHEMLMKEIGWCTSGEVEAEVISAPPPEKIRKAQGYEEG